MKRAVAQFVEEAFSELEFHLRFNPHGDVGEVSVGDVTVTDIFALEVVDEEVVAEAVADVEFTASFSYEDLDTGFYDKESGQHLMAETVESDTEDTCEVSIGFTFSIDEDGRTSVSELEFRTQSISVREEDRGDYDAWK